MVDEEEKVQSRDYGPEEIGEGEIKNMNKWWRCYLRGVREDPVFTVEATNSRVAKKKCLAKLRKNLKVGPD